MRVYSLHLCSYSHPKEFWGNGVRTHVNSKGKFPLPENFSSEEDRTHDAASRSGSEPNTLPAELFGLQTVDLIMGRVGDFRNILELVAEIVQMIVLHCELVRLTLD